MYMFWTDIYVSSNKIIIIIFIFKKTTTDIAYYFSLDTNLCVVK